MLSVCPTRAGKSFACSLQTVAIAILRNCSARCAVRSVSPLSFSRRLGRRGGACGGRINSLKLWYALVVSAAPFFGRVVVIFSRFFPSSWWPRTPSRWVVHDRPVTQCLRHVAGSWCDPVTSQDLDCPRSGTFNYEVRCFVGVPLPNLSDSVAL